MDSQSLFYWRKKKKQPKPQENPKPNLQEGEGQNKGESEINKGKLGMVGFFLFLNFSLSSLWPTETQKMKIKVSARL